MSPPQVRIGTSSVSEAIGWNSWPGNTYRVKTRTFSITKTVAQRSTTLAIIHCFYSNDSSLDDAGFRIGSQSSVCLWRHHGSQWDELEKVPYRHFFKVGTIEFWQPIELGALVTAQLMGLEQQIWASVNFTIAPFIKYFTPNEPVPSTGC